MFVCVPGYGAGYGQERGSVHSGRSSEAGLKHADTYGHTHIIYTRYSHTTRQASIKLMAEEGRSCFQRYKQTRVSLKTEP